MSILIADSGSTSTEWCLIGPNPQRWRSVGLNPHFTTLEEFNGATETFASACAHVEQVVFYGAGVGGPKMEAVVRGWLVQRFSNARFEIHNDLMAAARGCLGTEPGVITILGTGSNAAYYNGKSLVHKRESVGYVLGDAGSGADLGRRLLRAYYSHRISSETRTALAPMLPEIEDLLVTVYQRPQPNRFLASFARWMGEQRERPDIAQIVKQAIQEFVEDFVVPNAEGASRVGAVGSVGYYFSEWYAEACANAGMKLVPPVKSPLEGLIQYHSNA